MFQWNLEGFFCLVDNYWIVVEGGILQLGVFRKVNLQELEFLVVDGVDSFCVDGFIGFYDGDQVGKIDICLGGFCGVECFGIQGQ